MAGEQITVAGIQISQVVGNRGANISTATAAITAASGHDIYAFCPPFLDGEKCRLESLGESPGVLSGIVDIRYLEEMRRTYPYLTDRNSDMYGSDKR